MHTKTMRLLMMFLIIGVFSLSVGVGIWWASSLKTGGFIAGKITTKPQPRWVVRSIDTVKYSRDLALEKLTDEEFDKVIDRQVSAIARVGASHVSLGTPYDEKFVPFLQRWVLSARRHGLRVWYRGNFSGWEGWFGYPRISRQEHLKKTEDFILSHQYLFAHGDVFTACPECENGGPGDPRINGDVAGHRQFLIDEYRVTKSAFAKIHKSVISNFDSMNGDVARLIMDEDTTSELGGVVTIDHYVDTPQKLNEDISQIAQRSGGRVVLGEMGVPIPDMHGKMTEREQKMWLEEAFLLLSTNKNLIGVNYWVSVGGSTQLWDGRGKGREAVDVLAKYYKMLQI